MLTINPSVPIEIETRKNVFISQSRTGVRKTVTKSGAVRYYTLNFKFRDLDEFEEKLVEWESNYPGTSFEWTESVVDASGFFYFDSEFKAVAVNPNTFDYSFSLRTRDALIPSDPGTTTFPYQPNFAYDITTVRKILVSDSISLARVARATSQTARQFQYTFKNRTLTEALAAENFWAFHYPKNRITFADSVFDETMTFWFDSNFKWTVNSINLIDYSFVFTEIVGVDSSSLVTTTTALALTTFTPTIV
jgi:hypothetical protein